MNEHIDPIIKTDSEGNLLPHDPVMYIATIENIIANGKIVHSSFDSLNGIPYRIAYKGYTLTPRQGVVLIQHDESGAVYSTTWSQEGIMAHRGRKKDGSRISGISKRPMRTLNGFTV